MEKHVRHNVHLISSKNVFLCTLFLVFYSLFCIFTNFLIVLTVIMHDFVLHISEMMYSAFNLLKNRSKTFQINFIYLLLLDIYY